MPQMQSGKSEHGNTSDNDDINVVDGPEESFKNRLSNASGPSKLVA